MPPSQVKPPHTMLPTNPCIYECQVYPNGPYHCCAGSKQTLCHPSALVLFAPTPNSPPPSQIMPPMKPHLLQTTPSQFAVSAPEDTSTPGMTNLKPSSNTSTKCFKSKTQELSYAVCGNRTMAVMKNTTLCMCAGHVDHSHTKPAHALKHRRLQLWTPYRAEAWEIELHQTGLLHCFPSILSGLHQGFSVGYPSPPHVQTPPNSTSLAVYKAKFGDLVNKELTKGCYIGPLSFPTIETFLGPFQSSPLSLISKSSKLEKFCLVQNSHFPSRFHLVSLTHP